jgi:hypothetical protein
VQWEAQQKAQGLKGWALFQALLKRIGGKWNQRPRRLD